MSDQSLENVKHWWWLMSSRLKQGRLKQPIYWIPTVSHTTRNLITVNGALGRIHPDECGSFAHRKMVHFSPDWPAPQGCQVRHTQVIDSATWRPLVLIELFKLSLVNNALNIYWRGTRTLQGYAILPFKAGGRSYVFPWYIMIIYEYSYTKESIGKPKDIYHWAA